MDSAEPPSCTWQSRRTRSRHAPHSNDCEDSVLHRIHDESDQCSHIPFCDIASMCGAVASITSERNTEARTGAGKRAVLCKLKILITVAIADYVVVPWAKSESIIFHTVHVTVRATRDTNELQCTDYSNLSANEAISQ